MKKEVGMLLPKKELIQVQYGNSIIIEDIYKPPYNKIVIHTLVQYIWITEIWMTIWQIGWNLMVWLVGVVSRWWVRLLGGIYGYANMYRCS